MSTPFDQEIAAVLAGVQDPCSVAAGAPLSLVDMGLVRGWNIDEHGHLTVRLAVTSPLCTMAGHFLLDAETRLAALPSVRSVETVVDADVDWTPDSISPRGQRVLSDRRERARKRITGPAPKRFDARSNPGLLNRRAGSQDQVDTATRSSLQQPRDS